MENVDFNSEKFSKSIKEKTKSDNKRSATKNIDAKNFDISKASSLLKSNIMQIAIFCLIYFTISGIIGSFILLFTKPLYFLICISIGILLYFILKKKISNKFKF